MSEHTPANLENHSSMVDPFGRPVKSLRLSVTQRCDLACEHCHHEGQVPSADEMTPSEIERLVRVAASLGVGKVKITGGEPLMRHDLADIITGISPLVKEVSLTTNGSGLDAKSPELKRAGLARVNVSLHTLDADRYTRLCGVDQRARVFRGIEAAVKAGLNPVKVNMVVFKGENEDEIQSMIDFCSSVGAMLQLIEYEASRESSNGCHFTKRFCSLEDTERTLARLSVQDTVNELHRRRRYKIPAKGGFVTVEVVRPMHNTEFCSHCTRMRMSSDGLLKPCLLDQSGHVDVLGPLRSGASDKELHQLFLKAVRNRKPYWS
jgi:cyclic pyranopterin phosphate synthase